VHKHSSKSCTEFDESSLKFKITRQHIASSDELLIDKCHRLYIYTYTKLSSQTISRFYCLALIIVKLRIFTLKYKLSIVMIVDE